MDKTNPLYKDQGIHVILALFTVEEGKFKVLLIKRKNEPFKNKWILVGGGCYNNEDTDSAMDREIYEKTGMKNIKYKMFNVFSRPDRSPVMRMICIAHIGLIDCKKAHFLRETAKTLDADWFQIDRIPELGYDHKEILESAIEYLKEQILSTTILKDLFPESFTLPEVHKAYEGILNRQIDRRNFRKKLLSLKIIEDTGQVRQNPQRKSAKLYRFAKEIKKTNIL